MQGRTSRRHVLIDGQLRFAELLLGALTGLGQCLYAQLLGLLTAGVLGLEHSQPRIAQLLFVFLGPGFGRCNVGTRFRDGSLGTLATLSQDPLQWLTQKILVNRIQQQKQHHRRDGVEQ